jgi:hypothetical protein
MEARMSDIPCIIAAHDIAAEFFARSRALDDAQRAWLLARGIPLVALDNDPGRPAAPVRAARVVFAGAYFDFVGAENEDARPALCVIARDEFGIVDDIVAFDSRGRVGRWLGRAVLLGEQMRFFPRVESPALRVFADPWEWLRGERRGVVILDRGRARWRLAGEVLAVDETALGHRVRDALRLPETKIMVASKNARRAA